MSNLLTVRLPDIGEGVVEGEVVEWLKHEGDSVGQDEPVVIVMTDKATVELPAPKPGVFRKKYYEVGDIALLDHPLYDLEVESVETLSVTQEKEEEVVEMHRPLKKSNRALASPAVKHLAKQLGVDLSVVEGTGDEGQVTKEDVKRQLGILKPKVPPIVPIEGDREEPLVGVRGLMAETMRYSNEVIPHFSFFEELDVTTLKEFKATKKLSLSQVTYMPLFIKALSLALLKVPYANASIDPSRKKIIVHTSHNVGIAIDTPQGLLVPVLKGVEKMELDVLIEAFDLLKQRAREGKLTSQDMKEATVSMTNFGTLGGVAGTPVVPYPQVTICGLGKIAKKPVVIDDRIEIRQRQIISWSFDHRLMDGAMAAALSSTFIDLLENPEQLDCCVP